MAVLAEEAGGFAAAEADAAKCQDGEALGQGGELGGEILPGNPPVRREGDEGVLPGFADVQEKVGGAGGFELGGREFEFGFRRSQAAEMVVIDGCGDGRVFSADGTGGVAAEFEFAKAGAQGFSVKETSEQGVAGAGQELDGFRGLKGADESGEDAEDAGGVAIRHCAGRRRHREHAAVARRTEVRGEDADLSFKLVNRAVNDGLPQPDAGIAGEIAGGEIVRAIEDESIVRSEGQGVGGREVFRVDFNLDFRIEGLEAAGGGVGFGLADVFRCEKNLALEVG